MKFKLGLILVVFLFFLSCKKDKINSEKDTRPQTEYKFDFNPLDNNAYQIKAAELEKNKDYNQLLSLWELYQSNFPKSVEGHFNQSKIHLCLGMKDEAFSNIKKCIDHYKNLVEGDKYNSHHVIRLATSYILNDEKEKGLEILRKKSIEYKNLKPFLISYSSNEYMDYLPCKLD